MDDLNDPRISAYKPQRRLLIPAPPGPRQKLSKAKREQERRNEERFDARIARLHLVGLTDAAVIVMALALAVMVVIFVVVLTGRSP
jgi:hypothetical protein